MEAYSLENILKVVYESEGSVDIREHLDLLRKYASKCDHVTELGVRWVVSTWYLMAGLPKKLLSFDIVDFTEYGVNAELAYSIAKQNNVDFRFIKEDVLTTDKIEETDLLFIDTLHSYKQLSLELQLHGNKARKYLIFHDIGSFGTEDEDETPFNPLWTEDLKARYITLENHKGINQAIIEFLQANHHWHIDYFTCNNNGLMVLRRD